MAPPRSHSAKELAKRLHISERVLMNTLEEFEEDSMVKMFTRDRARLYIVNQKHKLLPQIQTSLVKNQKAYEDELFTAITKLGDVKAAFLSGAFSGQPQLPVDMLLVGKINLTKLDTFLKQCKLMSGFDINYSIMTPDEFQLRIDTFDRFLKDVFDYPHLVVVNNLNKTKKSKAK